MKLCLMVLAGLLLLSGSAWSQPAKPAPSLNAHLKPLAAFAGKTWRGDLTEPGRDTPAIDVARWERALNGQAIRVLHSINDGEYGGESLIFWDKTKETLVYYYFTTASFFTTGSMRVEGTKLISHEYVSGNDEGVTEVKSTNALMPDGTMHVWSSYLKKGEWTEGHRAVYREAPGAAVVFK